MRERADRGVPTEPTANGDVAGAVAPRAGVDGRPRATISPVSSRRGVGLFAGSLAAGCVVLLVAGLLLVRPVSADGGSVDCGSVRSPSTTFDPAWAGKWAAGDTAPRLAEEKCSRARDDRRNLAVAIGVVGVLFMACGTASELRRRRSRHLEVHGDESAERRVAWPIGLAGTLTLLVVLGMGYGYLALGVAEVTVVLVLLWRRPRTREVRTTSGILLAVVLAFGAYVCLSLNGPDLPLRPFHHPTGDAIAEYCSPVWSPRPEGEFCKDWRRDRAIEAALFGFMAIVAATATAVDAFASRRRSPQGHDEATPPAGEASA